MWACPGEQAARVHHRVLVGLLQPVQGAVVQVHRQPQHVKVEHGEAPDDSVVLVVEVRHLHRVARGPVHVALAGVDPQVEGLRRALVHRLHVAAVKAAPRDLHRTHQTHLDTLFWTVYQR